MNETCFLLSSTQRAGRTQNVNSASHTLERRAPTELRMTYTGKLSGQGRRDHRQEEGTRAVQRHTSSKECCSLGSCMDLGLRKGEKDKNGEQEKAHGKKGLLRCMKEFSFPPNI